MRIRRLLPGALFVASMTLAACSEKAEQVAAAETADQIEEAKIAGRNEAKRIITKNYNDTLELQMQLLEARSVSSRYDIEGKPRCREAFDSAFVATIRTVRPELANSLTSR